MKEREIKKKERQKKKEKRLSISLPITGYYSSFKLDKNTAYSKYTWMNTSLIYFNSGQVQRCSLTRAVYHCEILCY